MATAIPSLIHCVICDDVRQEIANKETIVGVYGAGVSIPFLPYFSVLCLWVTVIWSGDGSVDLSVRILDPKQNQIGETSGHAAAILQGHESSLTFRGLTFTAEMEGIYDLQWRVDQGPWTTIKKLPIFMPRP